MIFIDFNQVVITEIHRFYAYNKTQLTQNDLLHISFTALKKCTSLFRKHNIVIACDSKTYWRKDLYKLYKFHRKDLREKSPLDWNFIHKTLNEVKADLHEYFPYKVLEVDSAEADDIIGTLVPRFAPHGPVIICSADRDFVQLQQYPNVKQYDPKISAYVTSDDPVKDLKIKIIKGDRGDFIPSFLSPDDQFMTGKRQTRITEEKLQQWLNESPEVFCNNDTLQNYYRNQKLIDFNFIPSEVKQRIIDRYDELEFKGKNIFRYFMSKGLVAFLDDVGEFQCKPQE
jgi:hypothetical protein